MPKLNGNKLRIWGEFNMRPNSSEIILMDFQENDVSEKYVSWLNNKQHMKFSEQRFKNHSKSTAKDYLASFHNSDNRFYAIKSSLGLIGTGTLYVNKSYGTCSVGILIGPEFSGQGYGKQAWQLLTTIIPENLGLRKVSAGTLETNKAMLRLFEGSKMQFEARLAQEGIFEDLPVDILLFSRML